MATKTPELAATAVPARPRTPTTLVDADGNQESKTLVSEEVATLVELNSGLWRFKAILAILCHFFANVCVFRYAAAFGI